MKLCLIIIFVIGTAANVYAKGVIDGDGKVLMECVQCQSTTGNCSSYQTACPSGTTHCKATVVYMILDSITETPIYNQVSVVRECATAAVATGCSDSTSSYYTGLKIVTCTESCQEDGCNTGWPARPKCSSCVSNRSNDYDSCLENPPIPSDCDYPYQSYCYIKAYGIKKGSTQSIRGYPHGISRGCTHYGMGTSCASQTPHSTAVENCTRVCTTDGCNVALPSFVDITDLSSIVHYTNYVLGHGVPDGNEKVLIECVQCQGTRDCSRGQTTCPNGTTHCKATVVYTIFDIASETPIYQPESVVRECATATVATGCTSSDIGSLRFKKVTCTESCQENGCNTGWPARPKCSSCASSPSIEYDPCFKNPPIPSDCEYPYQSYCYIKEFGIKKGSTQSIRGYPHGISRGCTHYDMGTSCASQTPHSTEVENCTRVCTTDGCNVALPPIVHIPDLSSIVHYSDNGNGVIDGDEKFLMECVQCQGKRYCSRGRTACPSGTTHCKATVVYMISDRATETPIYLPVSVVRECATAAVATECSDRITLYYGGLSLKIVTCTESCQEDGCNTGWPARPKCSSCESRRSNEYDSCLENPPYPSDCDYPYQSYCYINEYGIKKGSTQSIRGYPHGISRGCTYYDMGTSCTSLRNTVMENCTRVCTTDGCNVGSGSLVLSQTFSFIAIATVIGWTA